MGVAGNLCCTACGHTRPYMDGPGRHHRVVNRQCRRCHALYQRGSPTCPRCRSGETQVVEIGPGTVLTCPICHEGTLVATGEALWD